MKHHLRIAFALLCAVLLTAASRAPLVLNGAQTQQLQSSDALKLPNVTGSTQCLHADTAGSVTGNSADCASSANPTATASDTAVNGSAPTFMRSDAAPPVQKASSSVFGIVKADGSTVVSVGGVLSAVAQGNAVYASAWTWGGTNTFTHSFACSGNLVSPQRTVTIYSASFGLTTVSSGIYKIGIAPYDTVNNKITSAPTYSSAFTETTGTSNAWVVGNFGTGVVLTGGSSYIMFIVRTDAGTTPSTTLQTSALANWLGAPGFVKPTTVTNGSFHLASTAPATSDVWTTENGFYVQYFGFGF